jgi:hypothetical protein
LNRSSADYPQLNVTAEKRDSAKRSVAANHSKEEKEVYSSIKAA